MAISGKKWWSAAIAVCVAVAVCASGCTPSQHRALPASMDASARQSQGASAHAPTPTPPAARVDGGAALGDAPPCLASTPSAWSDALTKGVLWTNKVQQYAPGVPAPEGGGIFRETVVGNRADFAIVGPDQKVIEDLGEIHHPDGAQFSYSAATADYIAFLYALSDGRNGQNAQDAWELYLFDRHTRKLSMVARNPTDSTGQPLQSGWVEPQLTSSYLYWIQGARTGLPWGGSAIEQLSLRTGAIRTLYSGLAGALAIWNGEVIYTGVPANSNKNAASPPMTVAAIAETTGAAAPPPTGVTAAADNAFSMRSDGDIIIWNDNRGALRGWSPDWGRSITLIPSSENWPLGQRLQMNGAGYPRIYKQYVVVDEGKTYVLDLKTNSFVQLTPNTGGEELSGSQVAIAHYAAANPLALPSAQRGTDQTTIDLSQLPDFGCATGGVVHSAA